MKQHKTSICIRRGTQSELAHCRLEIGELGFTTDTHMLFIGSEIGNLLLSIGIPLPFCKMGSNDNCTFDPE